MSSRVNPLARSRRGSKRARFANANANVNANINANANANANVNANANDNDTNQISKQEKRHKLSHKQSQMRKGTQRTTKLVLENNIEASKDLFNDLIIKNFYVDACRTNLKQDTNSFYSLLDRDVSQSDAIKLGYAIEKIFRDVINTNVEIEDFKEKNIKGVKEKDHLFYNKSTNTLYYAEVKANLILDTEKKPATIEKIKNIEKYLKKKYDSDVTIKSYLFAPRYFTTNAIPTKAKLDYIDLNLIGVNEYLKELGVNYEFADEKHYKDMINFLAYRMFDCFSLEELKKLHPEQTALGESITPKPTRVTQFRRRLYTNSANNTYFKNIFSVESPMVGILKNNTSDKTNRTNRIKPTILNFDAYV